MTNKYDALSIRGRVAYLIMCFERYVVQKYPEKDMSLVAKLMWEVVDRDYIDENAYRYMDVIPMFLFETDDYESSDMYNMTEEEYDAFVAVMPRAEEDPDLNTIMNRIYDVAMAFAYTVVDLDDPETKEYLQEVDDILVKHNIPAPDVESLPKYKSDETDGWGDFINPKPLSIILK